MMQLPSSHQIGDAVVLSFPPSVIKNAQIEAIVFKKGTVYYDVSIKLENPKWDKAMFTSVKKVHSAFVLKESEIPEQLKDK